MRDNSRFSNLSVLVVDSNHHTLSLTKTMLQSLGATQVTRATSAISACEVLQLAAHDLAIIDMGFHDCLSGVEIVQVVREGQDVGNPRVPIIMTSSQPDAKSVIAARDAGIHEFLRRPFSARDLHDRMTSALSERRSFISSPAYTGPDRRRADREDYDGEARRSSDLEAVVEAQLPGPRDLDRQGAPQPDAASPETNENETDPITGIANRSAFARTAAQMASDASRDGRPLALLMGDIDAFREMNETHGRKLGDQVLRLVSSCLTSVLKEKDFVARCGSDEFAVLLPDTNLEDSLVVAARILQTVRGRRITRRSTGEHFGSITMSVGAATHHAGEDPNMWVTRATRCLDAAKATGVSQLKSETDLEAGSATHAA